MTTMNPRPRVLMVHNAYLQRGGEDVAVEREIALLRSRQHEVIEYRLDNRAIGDIGVINAGLRALWSRHAAREVGQLIAQHRPHVMHVHNSFPLVSPAVFWTAKAAGVATVQTLHNFRLLCPQAMLVREGRVCEDCVGRFPLPGIVRGCYRSSRAQSATVAATVGLHRLLGTYPRKVDRFIALNDFCRRKFVEGGLPARKLAVKPNFADLPAPTDDGPRRGALYVGRLYTEKGIDVLAQAARGDGAIRLEVIGEGPEGARLTDLPNVVLRGWQSSEVVRDAMRRATCLVLTSRWYENFPMVVVEAFASGLPVVASRLGALAEVIEDGVTGLLFEPGNPEELASKLRWLEANPERARAMGARARQTYEHRYTASRNYEQLMQIYAAAREANTHRSSSPEPAYEM